ncbi:hypothetical protein MRB53_004868 [Persea americana]|uniref:Uncharacterized protein n=1 Tax=Persea americana TaxID=3435 RepID=A0ACC2MBR8_PERAE|nr:hypothetical protein MRB53_004868 [Persea americana]
MLRFSLPRAIQTRNLLLFNPQRGLHSRNKKAMELIAKGWNALNEVDRVIDYTDLNDHRLYPYFRTAKENFELALEIDNSNTHARYWLGRFHLKYQAPGTCKAVGAALLVEAAEMGDPDAQYELGCRLRVENKYVQSDQQAFYYLEKAVDQLHPGALYLLGSVYLAADCVKQDIASAIWCFHRASEKGHAGAAIAYGSLLLRGAPVPEALSKFTKKRKLPTKLAGKNVDSPPEDPIVKAKEQFQIAADAVIDTSRLLYGPQTGAHGIWSGVSDNARVRVFPFFFFFFFFAMEEITEGVNNININISGSPKKNRIQVSNTKKPLFFYVNLAKRYMQQYNEVELSALGMAISTVVTIAEILKNNGLAVEKKIMTSTVDMKDESRGRPIQKAKIEILLGKTENFDELMAAAAEEREAAGDGEDQS